MRERLLGRLGEGAALDGLRDLMVNDDPAQAPDDGQAEGHWHLDSYATLIGHEAAGPPEGGGAWEIACRLVSQYEFTDARIVRAVYGSGDDEVRHGGRGREQVWGWYYQTLQGHLETVRADGIVLAPSGARPHQMERLARARLHAGSQETRPSGKER